MSYKPSLCFAPAGIDACAFWRMWMPHLNTPGSRFQFTQGRIQMNEYAECDVVCIQRMMEMGNISFLQKVRQSGIKIVYDLDDNLWQIPKFNPAFQRLKSFDYQKGLLACMEWADVLTVSTAQLKRVVEDNMGHLNNVASKKEIPVVVIENAVDLNIFSRPLYQRDPDKVVIGWGGSNTHLGDIDTVWNIHLPDIVEKNPNVYLEVVGHEPPRRLLGHERVRTVEWCHISEFGKRYATWNWDIVLAPLDSHKFNRSKSGIKMVEAGAIAKPCLAQDFAPYQHFTSKMKGLDWLLCNYDWATKMQALIDSRQMRLDFGEMMYENVVKNFNIKNTVPLWEETCLSAYLA